MRVVITGAAGFLGQKLARRLAKEGELSGSALEELVLFDVVEPEAPRDSRVKVASLTGDIADPAALEALIAEGTSSVFHLAAIVSGQAEAEFDSGMRINLDGTRALLEACRGLASPPRLVFASSVAVFGGELPSVVQDMTAPTPETSYGAQKAASELLVSDYSRKGFLDGRSLRLPTVVVRPGRPNRAASTFASSIIREPLSGQEAICPVDPTAELWIASPRSVLLSLLHAHRLPAEAFGSNRSVTLPGLTVAVGEMVAALRRVAGEVPVARIRWQRDESIARIVAGWATRFNPVRALAMGFPQDGSMEAIIRAFIEDDLRPPR